MLPTDEPDPDTEYHERKAAEPEVAKPAVPRGFLSLIEKAATMDDLNGLYSKAVDGGFAEQIKTHFSTQKRILQALPAEAKDA
jgi:hypothetical protein